MVHLNFKSVITIHLHFDYYQQHHRYRDNIETLTTVAIRLLRVTTAGNCGSLFPYLKAVEWKETIGFRQHRREHDNAGVVAVPSSEVAATVSVNRCRFTARAMAVAGKQDSRGIWPLEYRASESFSCHCSCCVLLLVLPSTSQIPVCYSCLCRQTSCNFAVGDDKRAERAIDR